MKPAVAFSILLFCSAVLLGDSPRSGSRSHKPAMLLEDLVQMTRAGSSEVTVLAYAKAHRLELPPEVSDSDLRWLRDSGVSELVVRYMSAIDVRASGESAEESVAYGSSEDARPRASYSSSERGYDSSESGYPERYASGYADNDYDGYSGYGYGYGYGYGFDPSYGYSYYPYPSYFFIDRGGSFRRFHGRDHRFENHRGFDRGRGFRGHRGVVVGHGGSRDAWRERGFRGGRGNAIVVGPRGSGRPTSARGGFGAGPQGPRGRSLGDRGFGRPGSSRGSLPFGFREPRGGIGAQGGFSRPGFSAGSQAGGGFSRSPRVVTGPPGGRGRR